MKLFTPLTWILLGSILFTACTSENESSDAPEEAAKEDKNATPASETEIATSNTYSGFITVPPAQKISIHTPVSGFVRDIRIAPGAVVKKGQLLARIEHRDIIVIQEEYLQQLAQFEFTSAEFERKKKLHDQQVISSREFQDISARYHSMQVVIQSSERQLRLIGISPKALQSGGIVPSLEIRALSNGVLTAIHANEGMFSQEEAPLFEMVDTSKKYVEFEVYSADFDKITVGLALKFTVVGSPKPFTLEVAAVTGALNESKQSMTVVSTPIGDASELVIGSRVFVTF